MEEYVSMKHPMSCPDGVYRLAELWPAERPLFVVGGAVRDHVYSVYHRTECQPKDFDLASQLTADEVRGILRKARIPFVEVGAAFGIITARLDDGEYEIASFRSEWYDPESGDGRRPDEVQQGVSPKVDASRRDLYINALFYHPVTCEVRDYNDGKGLEDIANKAVRFVGNPEHRIQEDRLRIPRLVRFFSRYNDGDIWKYLDFETMQAVHKYKAMPGVSAERKLAEFLAGLKQAIVPLKYVTNLAAWWAQAPGEVSLLESMFPGIKVNLTGLNVYPACRNPNAVLAWLFRDNDYRGFTHSKTGLGNRLKFPSHLTDSMEFLLMVYEWANGGFDPQQAPRLVKRRDKFLRPDMTEQERNRADLTTLRDVDDFNHYAQMNGLELYHLLSYEPSASAQQFIDKGLQGKELGQAIVQEEVARYKKSLLQFGNKFYA